jgi:hypothetical protein
MGYTVGTFTMTQAAHVWSMNKTAAANTSIIQVPIPIPQNSVDLKGSCLKSIELWWTNGTADLTVLSVEVYKAVLPANGAAMAAPTLLAHTPDAGHDEAGETITQDEHKMPLTLDTPIWLDDDAVIYAEVTVNAAAGSVFKMFPARANFTLRL